MNLAIWLAMLLLDTYGAFSSHRDYRRTGHRYHLAYAALCSLGAVFSANALVRRYPVNWHEGLVSFAVGFALGIALVILRGVLVALDRR